MSDEAKTTDDAIGQLLAREAIRDCLTRYARAVDRCDAAMLESVYWPDATDEHGRFSGTAGEFIAWVMPLLLSMEQSFHHLGNMHFVPRSPSRINVETYFIAYHRVVKDRASPADIIVSGRYLDWMEERGGEWRIRSRTVIFDWTREFEDSMDWNHPAMGQGYRPHRSDDLSYALLSAA